LLSGCLRFWFKGRCGVTLEGGLLLWLKPLFSKCGGKCQGLQQKVFSTKNQLKEKVFVVIHFNLDCAMAEATFD
jgi:hypothetical protein